MSLISLIILRTTVTNNEHSVATLIVLIQSKQTKLRHNDHRPHPSYVPPLWVVYVHNGLGGWVHVEAIYIAGDTQLQVIRLIS